MNAVTSVVDQFQNLRSEREEVANKFIRGERPYLIFQTPEGNVWGDVRSKEECFVNNLAYIAKSLNIPSDHLPVMEPWFGTGVYANMYGCPYVWRKAEAPAVVYKFKSLEEITNVTKPNWENSEIAQLVLETIRYFKSKTGDALPIIWTDTQSASDTATLVLDATEFFIGCMSEPEPIMQFLKDINQLIIDFSIVQADFIGTCLANPGHIMLSNTTFKGMSVSDDNIAVGSPNLNSMFNLPLDEEIGQAMGGIAIHSCGKWTQTMPMLKQIVPSCMAIDCAIDTTVDPNPNRPEDVREALKGSEIWTHVRLTGNTEVMIEEVKRLLHPDLKLIIHPGFIDLPTAEKNYDALESLLSGFYGK